MSLYAHYCMVCQYSWYQAVYCYKCPKCGSDELSVTTKHPPMLWNNDEDMEYMYGVGYPGYYRYRELVAPCKKDESWDSGLEILDECPVVDKQDPPFILMDMDVYLGIKAIDEDMGNDEWLGYLLGDWDGEKKLGYISGLIIPEQQVTAASVKVTEAINNTRIIGTVHSHSSRSKTSFSKTDEDYTMANYPVTLLVSGTGFEAKARILSPCNRLMIVDADVEIDYPQYKSVVEEARKKISKAVTTKQRKEAESEKGSK